MFNFMLGRDLYENNLQLFRIADFSGCPKVHTLTIDCLINLIVFQVRYNFYNFLLLFKCTRRYFSLKATSALANY